MTESKEYKIASASEGNEIYVREWRPAGKPRAIVQISHGVDEHILRYDEFARFLNERGILVVGNDHLGHGRSVKREEDFLWFAEKNGWRLVVNDLRSIYDRMRAIYPEQETPYFLFGHSMGSFLARTYLIRYPGGLAGAIISGTNQMPGLLCAAGRFLAKRDIKKNGSHNRSSRINALAFGAYNKKFAPNRTTADWLSRDEVMVDEHIADPLCNREITSGLFYDLLEGLKFIKKPENLQKMHINTPVLFFAGNKDPVGRQGKGVRQAYRSFLRTGCRDVTLKLYPDGRHEMLNEINRAEVYEDVYTWIEDRIQQR